eukprot:COSAG03_NODE_20747_length_314_cov_1.120930_1_plen_31_part_10
MLVTLAVKEDGENWKDEYLLRIIYNYTIYT